jgi:FkbM family methyltransferase
VGGVADCSAVVLRTLSKNAKRVNMRQIVLNWIRRLLGTKQILDRLNLLSGELHSEVEILPVSDAGARDPDTVAKGVRLAISASDPKSFFKCDLNGVLAWLPTETLRTMIHCVHVIDDQVTVLVETAHIHWMIERLNEGKGKILFVDVGAATGAASIPVALTFKDGVKIIAFEPASSANRLLTETLSKNNIHGVKVVTSAVSDSVGEVSFVEYGEDPTGIFPFLPEASTISFKGARAGNNTTVKCVTLNSYMASQDDIDITKFNKVVVKVDVEGFEEHVLKGAFDFIKTSKPYFSIDIHARIGHDGETTEIVCRDLLAPFGYKFENIGHVLLASPS